MFNQRRRRIFTVQHGQLVHQHPQMTPVRESIVEGGRWPLRYSPVLARDRTSGYLSWSVGTIVKRSYSGKRVNYLLAKSVKEWQTYVVKLKTPQAVCECARALSRGKLA